MKKVIIAFFVLQFTTLNNNFAQTATAAPAPSVKEAADFFTGSWDIVFIGTPNGDAKSVLTLERKDGKLAGYMVSQAKADAEKNPLTEIEEEKDKIIIHFSAAGYDNLSTDLSKVDANNLEGKLMGMFDTKATRIIGK